MRFRFVIACLALTGLALGLSSSAVRAQNTPETVLSPNGGKPFTESWADMVRRDERIRREIAAGLRPAPPVLRFKPEREIPRPRFTDPIADVPFPAPQYIGQLAPPDGKFGRPKAPQALGTNFAGISLTDQFNDLGTGSIPPDTMGAIGPNHFLQMINTSVARYSRTGVRQSHVSLDSFFAVAGGYPRGGSFDPRLVYDRLSARWYACALEFNGTDNNHVILAVSRTSDPSGVWDKYVIGVGEVGKFTDHESLGVDANGVYMGFNMFGSTSVSVTLLATSKAPLVAATPSIGSAYVMRPVTNMFTAQPVTPMNGTTAGGRAWFISSSTTVYHDVVCLAVTWSGAVPTFGATTTVVTTAYAPAVNAPNSGGATAIDVGDDRLQIGVARNNRVWTCRNVGLNSSGGSSSPTRTGLEWVELDVASGTPSLVQSGRIYDPAAANPRFYYYGSLAVSGQGHVAVGMSGSAANQYIGAYTCGRLATDSLGTMQAIAQTQPGTNSYQVSDGSRIRWGDYSFTSVDPLDDQSIWTHQEYATSIADRWGTWTTRLLAPAPTLNNPAASGNAGATGVAVALTGTNFWDPGAGFTNRLAVQLTGGATNGISNYVVTFNSATSATVQFDIAAGATVGARNIVLTNPDGQAVTVTSGFTVAAGVATATTTAAASGAVGQTVTLSATLVRTDTSAALAAKTITFKVDGTTVGSGATDASGIATYSYAIVEGAGAGSRTIRAEFAGDGTFAGSFGTNTLTVGKANTTLYTIARTGIITEAVTLRSYDLKRLTDNALLTGRTINFKIDGTSVGTVSTDAGGDALYSWVITAGAASRTITVEFAGTAHYNPSSAVQTLTCQSWTTKMVGFNRTARITARTELKVRLLRSDNAPLYNKNVNFSVDGTFVITRPTAVDGYAKYAFYDVPDGAGAGTRPILSQWAGNAGYAAVSNTATLTVQKALCYIWVLPKSAPFHGNVNLYAYFRRLADYQKQTGKTVTFRIDGTFIQSVVTDAGGVARYTYTTVQAVGAHAIRCEFAGNAWLESGFGDGALTIY